jgi:hypothetical protein
MRAAHEPPSVHDLIPFDLALRLIFRRIYVDMMHVAVAGQAHVDGLAHVVSTMVPLYTYTDDREGVRQLSRDELKGGLFESAGKSVYFLDGRPRVTNLGVTSQAISAAMTALAMSLPDQSAAPEYED